MDTNVELKLYFKMTSLGQNLEHRSRFRLCSDAGIRCHIIMPKSPLLAFCWRFTKQNVNTSRFGQKDQCIFAHVIYSGTVKQKLRAV